MSQQPEIQSADEGVAHRETVDVHVRSLVTGESARFPMALEATLEETWAEAYRKLDERRREGDTLQCAGAAEGRSLMDDLGLTLREVRQRRICDDEAFRYEIKGPSGGA
jgi:hypothetical protein